MESDNNSPERKKMKITEDDEEQEPEHLKKRASDSTSSDSKRSKSENEKEVEVDTKTLHKRNYVKACELVSCKAYFDYRARLQLVFLPPCIHRANCKHQDNGKGISIREITNHVEEAVKIEIKSNGWTEALEVCQMCIMPDQYLSANVLKEIVEIMMNAHEDSFADYTIDFLIDKCQQILSQNFSTHPPCLVKSLRNCYTNFLTSPMELKEKSFTNRTEFQCDKGIVKYCMNRLESELSPESKDEPIVDKYLNIPEDMRQSVKGLHWQKEKFEIYEVLERPERIRRLMAVLESIIELMQFDLAIWHSRHTNNLSSNIMRSKRPLMTHVLWGDNILYTGTVNANCRQILRIFVYMIHLEYPECYIQIMTAWVNVIIQTFYICETNSNSDYPNTGKYCSVFSRDMYKIISELPYSSIIRVLERIQPAFMQHMIGTLHLQMILATSEDNIIKIFIEILKRSKLEKFPTNNTEIEVAKTQTVKPGKIKNIIKYLNQQLKTNEVEMHVDDQGFNLTKLENETFIDKIELDQKYIVHVLYVTMEAYLDAYSVRPLQDTLDELNENLEGNISMEDIFSVPEHCSYRVTEHFIKKYRTLYQLLTELLIILDNLVKNDSLPQTMLIFEKIGLVDK